MALYSDLPTVTPHRPIVTFLTDFGLADAYVAEMKAAVLRACPEATLVDVTHLIPPQDVLAGSIALERAVRSFPPGTVHLAVVDPGVGSERKILVAHLNGQTIIAPDNGLITWPLRRLAPFWRWEEDRSVGATGGRCDASDCTVASGKAPPHPGLLPQGKKGREAIAFHELLWRPDTVSSNTFHGRDIMGPVAGMIAAGQFDPKQLAPLDRPERLDIDVARSPAEARVIHIDHYGNCTTNVPAELLTPNMTIAHVGAVRRTYADAAPGEALALVGSSGLLEIAVRNGSAAKQLNLKVADKIDIR